MMKLSLDCVRDVMLYVENDLADFMSCSTIPEMMESLEKYDEQTLAYTCAKLIEAGYLSGVFELSDLGEKYICEVHSITFSGHEYLDKIRDTTIFEKARRIASENSGSISLSMFGKLCEKILDILLNKYLERSTL